MAAARVGVNYTHEFIRYKTDVIVRFKKEDSWKEIRQRKRAESCAVFGEEAGEGRQ